MKPGCKDIRRIFVRVCDTPWFVLWQTHKGSIPVDTRALRALLKIGPDDDNSGMPRALEGRRSDFNEDSSGAVVHALRHLKEV